MSNTVKHFGIINSDVIEQPESGSWYVTSEGKITTLKYVGNETKILAFEKTLPNVHQDLGDKGFPKFDKDEGGVWTLEIQYTLRWEGDGLAVFPNRINPYIQLTTQDIQKPLESNFIFMLVTHEGLPIVENIEAFESWKNAPLFRRVKFQYSDKNISEPAVENDAHWLTLGEWQKKLAMRVLCGQDSYLIGSQIVTQITVFTSRPNPGLVNKDYKISTPPGGSYTSNQKYLQKPSSLSQGQDGNWTMTDTWTGADYWDTGIYDA